MKKQGKKIFIAVLIAIMLGDVIVFRHFFQSPGRGNINNDLEKPESIADDIEKSVTEDVFLEENPTETKEEVKQEITEDDNNEKQSYVPIIQSDIKSTKQNNKKETISNSNQNANTQDPAKTEVKQNEKNNNKSTVDKSKEEVNEDTKNVEKPKQEQPKQNVHTYKYNSSIVGKIEQDIINNESEYMKKYGYNIVVDESIVTQTNQFTYTSNRVKDKIIYKFGTIKIYARDYYLNGNYMYTECYII